jgi:hypothetical protein
MMELDQLAFEVERFDFPDDDRLEVTGHWHGTSGRRFVRPTLHVRVDGRRRRMLALLDHKPWAPDHEGTWIAAFAWRGSHEGVTNARLEVGTDIVLELPAPGLAEPGTSVTPRPRPTREPRKSVLAPTRPARRKKSPPMPVPPPPMSCASQK